MFPLHRRHPRFSPRVAGERIFALIYFHYFGVGHALHLHCFGRVSPPAVWDCNVYVSGHCWSWLGCSVMCSWYDFLQMTTPNQSLEPKIRTNYELFALRTAAPLLGLARFLFRAAGSSGCGSALIR
jgi:hypothetical protein